MTCYIISLLGVLMSINMGETDVLLFLGISTLFFFFASFSTLIERVVALKFISSGTYKLSLVIATSW